INREIISSNLQLEYVRKTIQIIQLKYSEPLQVSYIADECGLNRSYLSRLFKDATGRSIQTYLMDYRMKNAVHLLKETNQPIQNVAFLVGYNDVFTFSRAFKKVFGMSPSDCRAAENNSLPEGN
ncbi:MAG: AraC family transcriptional regulator, partial [Lachnospiraceae bacterium]|nr:AraC family transcriptional regulator [Lachnospiraceae bacterium]